MGDMANRNRLDDTRTHHLTISAGKSYSIILPVEFIRHLGWQAHQKLDITLEGKKLIIKDWKK